MHAPPAAMYPDPASLIPAPRALHPAAATRASTDAEVLVLWLHGRSRHTARAYRRTVQQFMQEHAQGGLTAVRIEDLQDFADSLEARGLKASSRAQALAAIKSLLSFAHMAGYLSLNVGKVVKLPKVKDRLAQRILTEAQVLRMIARAERPRDYACWCCTSRARAYRRWWA